RRHTSSKRDWSSDVCSSDLDPAASARPAARPDPPEGLSHRPARARSRDHRGRMRPAPREQSPTEHAGSSREDPAPSSGLGAVLQGEEVSVAEAIGGPRGVAESVVPTLLFIVLYVATGSVLLSSSTAVAAVAVALILRIVQRQSPATVLGGLIGVALGA